MYLRVAAIACAALITFAPGPAKAFSKTDITTIREGGEDLSCTVMADEVSALIPVSLSDIPFDELELTISRAGDIEMSCPQISTEVSTMEEIIAKAIEARDEHVMASRGITVAKTVGSYLVGSLGGAIGIMAAGYIVSEATDNEVETAEAIQDIAEQRRSFMVGIYNAKGCVGPLELASIAPAGGGEEPVKEYQRPRKPRYND